MNCCTTMMLTLSLCLVFLMSNASALRGRNKNRSNHQGQGQRKAKSTKNNPFTPVETGDIVTEDPSTCYCPVVCAQNSADCDFVECHKGGAITGGGVIATTPTGSPSNEDTKCLIDADSDTEDIELGGCERTLNQYSSLVVDVNGKNLLFKSPNDYMLCYYNLEAIKSLKSLEITLHERALTQSISLGDSLEDTACVKVPNASTLKELFNCPGQNRAKLKFKDGQDEAIEIQVYTDSEVYTTLPTLPPTIAPTTHVDDSTMTSNDVCDTTEGSTILLATVNGHVFVIIKDGNTVCVGCTSVQPSVQPTKSSIKDDSGDIILGPFEKNAFGNYCKFDNDPADTSAVFDCATDYNLYVELSDDTDANVRITVPPPY